MSACGGTPVAVATYFRTTTTVLPTFVVQTVSDDDDDNDTSASRRAVDTEAAVVARYEVLTDGWAPLATLGPRQAAGSLTTITSSYTTSVVIPTSTLFSTPAACEIASTTTATSRGGSSSSSTSNVVRSSTQTVTSALATVSDPAGRTSVVLVTLTQTLSSASPVVVVVTADAPEATISSGATTETTSSSTMHTGTVVGAIVGGVAGLAILAMAFWFLMRRRRRMRDTTALEDLFQRSTGRFGGAAVGTRGSGGPSRGNSHSSTMKGPAAYVDEQGQEQEEEEEDGQVPEMQQHGGEIGAMPTLNHDRPISRLTTQGGSAGWGAHDHRVGASPTGTWQNGDTVPSYPGSPQSADAPIIPAPAALAAVGPSLGRSASQGTRLSTHQGGSPPQGHSPASGATISRSTGGAPSPNEARNQDGMALLGARPASTIGSPRSTPSSPNNGPVQFIGSGHPSLAKGATLPRYNSYNNGRTPPPGHFGNEFGRTSSSDYSQQRPSSRPNSPPVFQTPPSRPTSPASLASPTSPGFPSQHRPRARQTLGPGTIPDGLDSRAISPYMWMTPDAGSSSTPSSGAPQQPRPMADRSRAHSSGNLSQMVLENRWNSQPQHHQQPHLVPRKSVNSAYGSHSFGVHQQHPQQQQQRYSKAAGPSSPSLRGNTASPPPRSLSPSYHHDQNWPPSRYSHLDVGSQDNTIAAGQTLTASPPALARPLSMRKSLDSSATLGGLAAPATITPNGRPLSSITLSRAGSNQTVEAFWRSPNTETPAATNPDATAAGHWKDKSAEEEEEAEVQRRLFGGKSLFIANH